MNRAWAMIGLSVLGVASPESGVQAAEGAVGFYLLGSKGSMAGYLPPPGTYIQTTNYFYTGDTDSTLEVAGLIISGGVDADAYYSLPTAIWVAPEKVLGGNIAFSAIAPIGWKDVSAGVTLTGPLGGVLSTNLEDEETKFGDPVVGAMLGWHQGNWHWNVGSLLNIPVGFWERGNLANIGFNRWAIDTTGAVTWLDPKIGLEFSAAAGFTYNFENSDTDYKTGTEFHFEFAAIQNFSKAFAIGLVGYYYDQISGDSGSGARLGGFEGRVLALGPAVNLNFALGKIPVSTNLKYFHEFEVENRLEGDAGYLTITMPLSVSAP
jgi:hypothetical protein